VTESDGNGARSAGDATEITPRGAAANERAGIGEGAESAASASAADLAGIVVPGYTLLAKLGAGGMGVVYLAEQERPRRRVALKIVRGGPAADDLSVRLFQREADTLARLRHPQIAALYEVGRTAAGQHYLTMELVSGPTLGEWLRARSADGAPAPAERRLRLAMFRDVCDAVHYAHQRGVIHRDLKPSNLIVRDEPDAASSGRDAATPRVVILDFGLARIVDADADAEGHSLLSRTGEVRGTLAYMSPEQAMGDRDRIDVRSDVYSLGVILFETLTGERPYDLSGVSVMQALRAICEQPPRSLAKAWPGHDRPDPDLETIVSKALSKDPADRYGSAAALGEEIERHLTSQPILARPPSTMYQLRKLIARRKAPFAIAAALLLLIVAAAIGMGALYVRADRNLARAVRAERSARAEATTAQRTADFLVELFDGSSPDRSRGERLTAREVLDVGARRIERELAGEPLMQARLMTTIGEVYRKLALYEESLVQIERGLALRRENLPPDDAAIGASLNARAMSLERLGRVEAAEASFRESIAQLAAAAPRDTTKLISAYSNMAGFLSEHRKLDEAAALLDSARALAAATDTADDARDVSLLTQLSLVKMNAGDVNAARSVLEEALPLSRRIHGDLSPSTANIILNIGVTHGLQGRPQQAEGAYREGLRIRETLYGAEHPLVAQAVANVGMSLAEQGRLGEARPFLERSAAITEKVLGPDHRDVATELTNLGLMNLQLGDADRAAALLERARSIRERTLGPDSPRLALTLYHLAGARMERREYAAACDLLERVVAIDSMALGPDHPDVANDLEGLAEALAAMGDRAGARRATERMDAIRAKAAAAEAH
jgi:serine/threonine protein kinase/Tfp pilus assembly protein PilF